MSTATYLQRGESWDYINPGTTPLEPGTIVVLGDRIGVVGGGGVGPLLPGQLGIAETVGVWEIEKAADEAIAQGAVVYYDEATGTVTATPGSVVAGRCCWNAAAADKTVRVDIKAPGISGSVPAASDSPSGGEGS